MLPFDGGRARIQETMGRRAVLSAVPFDGQPSQAAELQRGDMVQVLPLSQAKTRQAAQCLERDAALQPG